MVVCTYHISRMSSVCCGGQHGTAANWLGEFNVAVYNVI
jgi:hypothetical protein